MCTRRVALFVLIATAAPLDAQVVTFQQGVGGYTGYQDSQIVMGGSTVMTDYSPTSPGQIRVDPGDTVSFDAGYVYGLMRFNNIFGTGAGQIPAGSRINSATLRLNLTEDTADGFLYFHRMITDWSDTTATWTLFSASGVQLGTHAVATADATIGPSVSATAAPGSSTAYPIITADVTSSLQAWSNGFANRGWNIRPDNGTGVMSATDGILFSSAEDATAGNHPLLTVNFTPATVPEPGVLLLTGLGLATFGAARYRRWRAKDRNA